MAELQRSEFIYEQPAPEGARYVFKHALTHEVAYESILIKRRELLHELVGRTIEALYAAKLDDHLGQLAFHYQHSRSTAKALEYLLRAGQQAISRSSNTEAVSLLISGLDLIKQLPETPERGSQELGFNSALRPR